MSATKHYIETNCYYDENTDKFKFIDGYEESAPKRIMQQRLKNAGFDKTHHQIKSLDIIVQI